MNEETILSQRGASWKRLQDLTSLAGHRFKRLSDQELEEFVRLYRQTSADLAFLTTHSSNESVVQYLNAIVGQAYSQLYREPYKPWGQKIADALAATADTVRRRRRALYLAIGVFFAGVFAASSLLSYSDEYRNFYIPQDPMMQEVFESWKSGKHEQRTGGEGVLMMAFYASNNPRVSIIVNALSVVSFGVFTTYMVWENGALLGALGHEVAGAGTLDFMVLSVLPHGVTEIGGIFMAAAGGFVLAGALIMPGRRSRGEALRVAGKDAFVFLVLSVLMTLLASPIEGFFSFDPRIPMWMKGAVAGLTLFGWLAFFIGYGRGRPSIEGTEQLAR